MAAVLQFVDSIAASPTLRLDINDGTIWLLEEEGTDYSPPALKTATADILLNDGATRSASSYENRRLKLRLSLKASSEDDKATKLRALHIELNRTCNILKYQPGTTPLFFRTLRSPEYTLDETPTYALTYVSLDLEAEPFAYGLRVDLAGVSVKSDPSLANGCYLDVNGVTGDVDTPAYVALSAGTVPGGAISASYLAVRRHGTPASLQFVYQAETALGLSTDTAVTVVNDATASPTAGNNYAETTFATNAAFAVRATLPPAAAELRGTYRVLIRVKKTVSTDVITIGLNGTVAATLGNGVGASWMYVDLGLVQWPRYDDSPIGFSGVYPSLSPSISDGVYAGRTSGTGRLRYDLVLYIPADENVCVFTPGITWSSSTLVLDGPNDTGYYLTGGLIQDVSVARAGSIPTLRVGNNRLYLVENITTATVATTTTVTVSYWPRYLTV